MMQSFTSLKTLLDRAYGHFSKGEPLPVDLEVSLTAEGFNPDGVIEAFEDGYTPTEIIEEKEL